MRATIDTARRAALALLLTTALAAAVLAAPAAAQEGEPIRDPIPEQPIQSGVGLELTEIARLPQSNTYPGPPVDGRLVRWNRINYLGEVPDGSGRMYVPDLNGKLYMIEDGDAARRTSTSAPRSRTPSSRSRGLGQRLRLRHVPPGVRQATARFYTVHVEDGARAATRDDRTSRRRPTSSTASSPSGPPTTRRRDSFSGTRREVLRVGFGGQIHGIQQIDFNPRPTAATTTTACSTSRSATAARARATTIRRTSPCRTASSCASTRGARTAPTASTASPTTTRSLGTPGALGEIYAVGLRDPHRFSWDPGGSHRMFLGHIGEHAIEAVYEVRPGDNSGWSEREGPFLFDKTPAHPCDRLPAAGGRRAVRLHLPGRRVSTTTRRRRGTARSDIGHAIIGGFVYRGRDVPELRGKYVFGDLVDRPHLLHRGERDAPRPARRRRSTSSWSTTRRAGGGRPATC